MVKKVIQVPVEKELLACLDRVSKKQHRARAELIREACVNYLRRHEEMELDDIYRRGYEKLPEKADLGQMQAGLAGRVLTGEDW